VASSSLRKGSIQNLKKIGNEYVFEICEASVRNTAPTKTHTLLENKNTQQQYVTRNTQRRKLESQQLFPFPVLHEKNLERSLTNAKAAQGWSRGVQRTNL